MGSGVLAAAVGALADVGGLHQHHGHRPASALGSDRARCLGRGLDGRLCPGVFPGNAGIADTQRPRHDCSGLRRQPDLPHQRHGSEAPLHDEGVRALPAVGRGRAHGGERRPAAARWRGADSFIGDAVVAIFGAPLHDPDHALHAVEAAIAIRSASADAARELAYSGGRPPATRVGVNTGPVVIGNIGSPRRFNYTAMGDAVNLASRLEGVNKRYGTLVLVSEATAQACGEAVVFREIDTVAVKGRERPVALFEPLGLAGEVARDALAHRSDFAKALRQWRGGQWAQAASAFEMLAGADAAAAHFAALARDFAAAPPADWQGVSVLTEK